jgi:hypothetical protein
VSLRRDHFLKDIKRFLYNYCTSGRLFTCYHKHKLISHRQDEFLNLKAAFQGALEAQGEENEELINEQFKQIVDKKKN